MLKKKVNSGKWKTTRPSDVSLSTRPWTVSTYVRLCIWARPKENSTFIQLDLAALDLNSWRRFTYSKKIYKTVQPFIPIVVVWMSDIFIQPKVWEWDRSEVSKNRTCLDFGR